MNKQTLPVVLKSIAVAMGVAVIVLNVLNSLPVNTAITLLGIGLAALAIAALQR